MSTNPLLLTDGDPDDPTPIVELKTRLILYLSHPPGPVTARRVYDLYLARYGDAITHYRSTALGDLPEPWTPAARLRFEQHQLPDLRKRSDWGYLFGSDRPSDARTFLFHGFRPASEPGMASVFRFDFEWDFDPNELKAWADVVLAAVECVCGVGGFVLNPDEGVYANAASNRMYAWARRYWGAEAQDLETSPAGALHGLPCVNWLTVIGPELAQEHPDCVDRAKAVALSHTNAGGHTVLQVEERPRLMDRHRRETLGNYPAVADALLPLQTPDHPPFIGDMWDEDNTMRYLRRFTHPDEV